MLGPEMVQLPPSLISKKEVALYHDRVWNIETHRQTHSELLGPSFKAVSFVSVPFICCAAVCIHPCQDGIKLGRVGLDIFTLLCFASSFRSSFFLLGLYQASLLLKEPTYC